MRESWFPPPPPPPACLLMERVMVCEAELISFCVKIRESQSEETPIRLTYEKLGITMIIIIS